MRIFIYRDKEEMGRAAAEKGADLIRKAIRKKGEATIIVATGASQFEMLAALVGEKVNWSRVTGFHLDEYIGLPASHPASFRKYLKERFVSKVPLKAFHYVNGEADPQGECERLGELIGGLEVDVAFIGIGENGHLAFNDPPADFEGDIPYIVVELDQLCREQQLGEGWFPDLESVPGKAISMSVKQILKSRHIVCTVPDERKARAVKCTVEGGVDPLCPASVLKTHQEVELFLDQGASTMINRV